jgi:hypothetical protein
MIHCQRFRSRINVKGVSMASQPHSSRGIQTGITCLLLSLGCAQAKLGNGGNTGAGAAGGAGPGGGGAGAISLSIDAPTIAIASTPSYDAPLGPDLPPPITDFPADPILNGANLPANVPDLFANTQQRTSGPPCIVSPEPNTLVPRNWLRPRFEFYVPAQENTFEIILTVAAFAHPLRIYTAGDPTHAWHNQDQTYALPGNLWDELRASVTDQPITVQVRAMTLTTNGTVQLQPSPPSTSTFTIAPVDAPGKIVYWSLSSAGLGSLKGFGIGEEGVASVLVPGQVQASDPTVDDCIGCHSATPDGFGVGMVLAPSNNAGDAFFESLADIRTATLGMTPSYLDPGALATLRQLKGGTPTYSLSHWLDGDYISLTSSDNGSLTWVQLDSPTAQGTLARTGDPSSAATEPTFSHDGNTVVYVSGSSIYDGRLANGPADLYSIPYNNRQGGAATPVAGASSPDNTEYYPAFSPDDAYLAFSSFAGNGNSYSNNQSEVFVVPSGGGTAIRPAANDVPACLNNAGLRSPGLGNDWAKWSPHAVSANGKTYYWLTFSSSRSGQAQLFVTGLVLQAGTMTTYPAVYLWNQPSDESNHTPCWDDWQIPPVPIVY